MRDDTFDESWNRVLVETELYWEYYEISLGLLRGDYDGLSGKSLPIGSSWGTKENTDANTRLEKIRQSVSSPVHLIEWCTGMLDDVRRRGTGALRKSNG